MAFGEVWLAGVPLVPLNETIGYIASYASGDVAVIILIFFTLKCLEHVIKWHLMVTMFFSFCQNVSPNMKLWGVVTEVNQKDIVLSLPGGMRGFVRSEDVCDIALQENRKVGVSFS